MSSYTKTIKTRDGDMLDELCVRHYGRSKGILEQVLAANLHLLDYPEKLPAGVSVRLPAIAQEASRQIQLWESAS